MESKSNNPRPKVSTPWKIAIASINLALGNFLWFVYFTNYSVAGKYFEFLFPLIVGVIGFLSCLYLLHNNPNKRSRRLYRLANMPSIIGGLSSSLLFFTFPAVIFSFSLVSNASRETRIHQVISPNGLQVANIYHGYAGTVDADEKITIRVCSLLFPVIEREIYYTYDSRTCTNNPSDCIRWMDNETILYPETMERIKTDKLELSLPLWFLAIIATLELFFLK